MTDGLEEQIAAHVRDMEIRMYGKPKSEMNDIELQDAKNKESAEREKQRLEDLKHEAQQVQWQRQQLVDALGIPARYRNSTLDGMRETCEKESAVINRCKSYMKRREYRYGTSLLFLGSAGCGKTHIGCSMIKEVAFTEQYYASKKGLPRYTTFVKLMREIQDTYRNTSERSTTDVMEFYFNSELLVIDEVGAQRGSQDEHLQLHEILRERHANMKATILISNLGVRDFKEHVGDLIIDRLKEDNSEMLTFGWPSHRGSKAITSTEGI